MIARRYLLLLVACGLAVGCLTVAGLGRDGSSRRASAAPVVSTPALDLPASAPLALRDENDRAAFRQWFTWLADTAHEHPPGEVTDCAALVRWAAREALRRHTSEWRRRLLADSTDHRDAGDVRLPAFADVRHAPAASRVEWPLFRTGPFEAGEFANAATLWRWNARPVGRDPRAARPADLLFFRQPDQELPYHVMIFIGRSAYEAGDEWVVYHTGPAEAGDGGRGHRGPARPGHEVTATSGPTPEPGARRPAPGGGEIRKVALAVLRRHPDKRWRPEPWNPDFLGVFRLSFLQ